MELMAYARREWLWKQPENNQKEKQLIYWEVYVYLRPFTGCGLNLKTNKQSQSKKQTNKQKIQKNKKKPNPSIFNIIPSQERMARTMIFCLFLNLL